MARAKQRLSRVEREEAREEQARRDLSRRRRERKGVALHWLREPVRLAGNVFVHGVCSDADPAVFQEWSRR